MQESARSLRGSIRQTQAENGYINLLHALASDCYKHGWSLDVANRLLNETCANLGATNGFIAAQDLNTLEVIASVGDSYPQAARIPIMGQLANILKPPCKFACHHNIQRAAPHNNNDAHSSTFTAPIACNSRPVGIIVLAMPQPSLTESQLQLCETICGLMGLILMKTHSKQTAPQDLSIIDALTPREREVFALLPSGKSNAELGALLGIAGGTVKIHVERILNKLGLNDRTQAAVKAVELGFSSSDSFTD